MPSSRGAIGSKMGAHAILFAVLCISLTRASDPAQCSKAIPKIPLNVPLSKDTVAWGYFWRYRDPVAYVKSGETFTIEMASHHAGDYYDGFIKGDAAMEAIYKFNSPEDMNIKTRGRSGRADGKHIMTGPVYICGAEPGDTLEIQILDMKPRRNPQGKAFSSNGLAAWGWQNRIKTQTDATFIYELILDAQGYAMYAEPRFTFTWKDADGNPLVETPCWNANGTLKANVEGQDIVWSNPANNFTYTVSGFSYNCVDGKVKLGGYHYAGAVVNHPIGTEDYSISGKWRLPVSPHIGNIGIASDVNDTTNSAWPMRTGGNIDQKRLGVGSKLFLPVEVKGALLSGGDCHAGQTASEYSGTALETNFNAKLKVIVHKKNNTKVPSLYKDLITPLLENDNEWCWHGYTVNDYLHDPLTAPGWNTKLPPLATDTYKLMNNTAYVATEGLKKLGFTRDEASSILTFACDWEVTQVVNTNMGNNICCYKYIFPPTKASQKGPFTWKTFPGSSRPLKIAGNKIMNPYK